MKDVAPGAGLRRWLGHEKDRWPEFRSRYREELRRRQNPFSVSGRVARSAG
jgi:uncharacterized protein YeaO (DUF488 family)